MENLATVGTRPSLLQRTRPFDEGGVTLFDHARLRSRAMSADDNINTVKKIYDAFGRGDVGTILDLVTDDVDWAAESASDVAPWHGPRKGKDGVTSFFEAIGGALEVSEFTPLSYAATDNEVLTLVRFGFKSRTTGKDAAMNLHHYFRFRDGKVEFYRGSEDTAHMATALQA
jgi:ketosteroid isomerase-like protein